MMSMFLDLMLNIYLSINNLPMTAGKVSDNLDYIHSSEANVD